jgi:hypothetical protein
MSYQHERRSFHARSALASAISVVGFVVVSGGDLASFHQHLEAFEFVPGLDIGLGGKELGQ